MKQLNCSLLGYVSGGMGNGATQKGVTAKESAPPNTGCNNGITGGAVAGFFGGLATGTPVGLLGVIAGSTLGGAIAGGCFDSSSSNSGPGDPTKTSGRVVKVK